MFAIAVDENDSPRLESPPFARLRAVEQPAVDDLPKRLLGRLMLDCDGARRSHEQVGGAHNVRADFANDVRADGPPVAVNEGGAKMGHFVLADSRSVSQLF